MFVEPCGTTAETVEAFCKNERLTVSMCKLGSSRDVYFFVGGAVKEGVANIRSADIKVVEVGKEETYTDGLHTNDAGVNVIFGWVSEVSSGNQTCFPAKVKFHIKYDLIWYLFIAGRDGAAIEGSKGFVLVDLLELPVNCLLPESVVVHGIQLEGMFNGVGNLNAEFVCRFIPGSFESSGEDEVERMVVVGILQRPVPFRIFEANKFPFDGILYEDVWVLHAKGGEANPGIFTIAPYGFDFYVNVVGIVVAKAVINDSGGGPHEVVVSILVGCIQVACVCQEVHVLECVCSVIQGYANGNRLGEGAGKWGGISIRVKELQSRPRGRVCKSKGRYGRYPEGLVLAMTNWFGGLQGNIVGFAWWYGRSVGRQEGVRVHDCGLAH